MKMQAWWLVACAGCSSAHVGSGAEGVHVGSDADVLDASAAGDGPGEASDDGGGVTFGLSVRVPCADSTVLLADVVDVPYGVSATWRLPSGETHVRQVAITSTPRDERRPVTFCFDADNAAKGVGESIGFLTGDAFFHMARVQPGASCVDALVAGTLTTTHGTKTLCDSGM